MQGNERSGIIYVRDGPIQQEIPGAKTGIGATGEMGWYEMLPNGRMNRDPDTGALTPWILIGGTSRAGAQSGGFGFAAASKVVYARGGVQSQTFKTPEVMSVGAYKSDLSPSEIINAIKGGTTRELMSRPGAEGYGGVVTRLDGRTLGSITYEDVSNREPWNFASYVNPADANKSKAELPGVRIPWGVPDSAPGLFTLTPQGGVGAAIPVKSFGAYITPRAPFVPSTSNRLIIGEPGGTRYGESIVTQISSPMAIGNVTPTTTQVKGTRPDFVATSPMGVEIGMREGFIPKPFMSGGGGTNEKSLPNFYDIYGKAKSDYTKNLAEYEAGGSTNQTQYNQLTKDVKTLNQMGIIAYTLEIGRPVPEITTTKTTRQRDDILGEFMPVNIETTVTGKWGATTTVTPGQTPLNTRIQNIMPDAEKINFRVADLANPRSMPFTVAGITSEKLTDIFNPSKSKEMRETHVILEGYTGLGGKYSAFREDPTMAAISYATGAVLGSSGGVLASMGGEKYLFTHPRALAAYTTVSKVGSGTIGIMYGSDVSKRVTGTSFSEAIQLIMPTSDKTNRYTLETAQQNWGGFGPAAKQVNKIIATEVVPFIGGFASGSKVGAYVYGRVLTRKMTRIETPREFAYDIKEGYPTNQNIQTQDLVDSFNQGTLKLKGGNKAILESKMSTGEPLTRVPSHPQRDAALFGETHTYSAAPGQRFPENIIKTSEGSELPVLFVSSVGDSYFTKAGQMQGGGGFGITGDILGIMNRPTMYRPSMKTGDIAVIPEKILNTPLGRDPITGRAQSINDPSNPRNIAIRDWIETNAKYGQLSVGQSGKSEWQGYFKEGSAFTKTNVGYYEDPSTGTRIIMDEIKFTGKGTAPKREVVTDLTTGKPAGREIARMSMGVDLSESTRGLSKSVSPITMLIKGTTPYDTSKSRSSVFSSSQIPYGLSSPGISTKSSSNKPESYMSKPASTTIPTPKTNTFQISEKSFIESSKLSPKTSLITISKTPSYSPSTSTKSPIYSPPYSPVKTPPYSPVKTPPYSPVKTPPWGPPTKGGVLPGGSRGGAWYGSRYRSTVATHPVGADYLGASRGSFRSMRMPKMKFKLPKF
jgi:hypothetical protein